MDLESGFYVGYGASLKSEREAFDAALVLMGECGVKPASIRLDQYYARQSVAELFGKSRMDLYVIPKCNALMKDCLYSVVGNPHFFPETSKSHIESNPI